MAKIDMNVHEIDQVLQEAAEDKAVATSPPPEVTPPPPPPPEPPAIVEEPPATPPPQEGPSPEETDKETTPRRRRRSKDDAAETLVTPSEVFQEKLLPAISELANAITQANERAAVLELKYSDVVKKLETLVEDLKIR